MWRIWVPCCCLFHCSQGLGRIDGEHKKNRLIKLLVSFLPYEFDEKELNRFRNEDKIDNENVICIY